MRFETINSQNCVIQKKFKLGYIFLTAIAPNLCNNEYDVPGRATYKKTQYQMFLLFPAPWNQRIIADHYVNNFII